MSKYPDISHYRPVTDWGKVKANVGFLISKATQGISFVDSTLDSFINGCEANGIPYWLYTYLNKGNEKAQAEFMVKTCKNKVGKYFVGYILDVEAGNTAAGVKAALDYLNTLGVKTMIYTMYGQYSKYSNVIAKRGNNCAWWEARYGVNNGAYSAAHPCHVGVDLHQFTSNGSCPGINGKIDLNRLTGRKEKSWFTTPAAAIGLSKTRKFVGKVTADVLNVRTWAGTQYPNLPAYKKLLKGNLVDVCDTVKAADGADWYYICIAKKYYGYVHSAYIKKA